MLAGLNLKWVALEQQGPVLRAWLNRPEARNAQDQAMLSDFVNLFTALNNQTDIRVVVLGGRGPTFCAGADRKSQFATAGSDTATASGSTSASGTAASASTADTPASGSTDAADRYGLQLGRRATRAIEDCEVVTIARVHGHAIGGGCCIAMSCDFRITTTDALWYVPEVGLGLALPWGATPRLISEIGMARARQLIMTSERVDGRTALAWGMAHEACADTDELDTAVDRWVQRILEMPALSVQMTKHQLRGYGQVSRLGDLSEFDADATARSMLSADAQAGFANF